MPYILTGIILIIIIIWIVASYNSFINLKNKVEEAFSTMDVYLKKRSSLIPNVVETVKGYAAHESSTLEKVITARNAATSATGANAKMEAEGELTSTLRSLFALAENYPDLKANQNFLNLQSQLAAIEDDIANSRKYYNGVVRMFNTSIMLFPKNILAALFRFEKMPMFEVDEASRQDVNVQF